MHYGTFKREAYRDRRLGPHRPCLEVEEKEVAVVEDDGAVYNVTGGYKSLL